MSRSETSRPYRYEATITLVIYADGQDSAWSLAREAANAARISSQRATVEQALTSMTDLHYRPTVKERWTGESRAQSERSAEGDSTPAPGSVGADPEHTPRGHSGV